MVSVWPQWRKPVGSPRDRIWDLVTLVWPIRSRVITTSLALVRCWQFSSVAPVLVSQDRDLCHVQLHPTWFDPTSECRSWPVVTHICIVDTFSHMLHCHCLLVNSGCCSTYQYNAIFGRVALPCVDIKFKLPFCECRHVIISLRLFPGTLHFIQSF